MTLENINRLHDDEHLDSSNHIDDLSRADLDRSEPIENGNEDEDDVDVDAKRDTQMDVPHKNSLDNLEKSNQVIETLLFEDPFRDLEKTESNEIRYPFKAVLGQDDLFFNTLFFFFFFCYSSSELSKSESIEVGRNETLNYVSFVADVNLKNWGLPLPIFTDGNFCMPYLCVTDLDFLSGGFCRGEGITRKYSVNLGF